MHDTDPGRRERKRKQTADLLANTAFALFEAHGFDAVTMERIAVEADVAKGTLYNHFPVKEALLAHRFQNDLRDAMPALRALFEAEADPIVRMRVFFQAAAHGANKIRSYLPYYLQYRLGQPLRDQSAAVRSGTAAVLTRLIADAQGAGRLRSDPAAEQLSHYLELLYLGALTRWLLVPDTDLATELDSMLSLFLQGAAETTA